MAKQRGIEELLKAGSAEWNKLRKAGQVAQDHTGATFFQLFSANADLSELSLVGTEWEACDLSRVSFRESDLSNAYFHGGRMQDCDFRGVNLDGATFERLKLLRCDFTGARGLESLELDDVDMDRVVGLDDEPPDESAGRTVTITMQGQAIGSGEAPDEAPGEAPAVTPAPPFRPQDPPAVLLQRAFGSEPPPPWALDAPELKLPLPKAASVGTGLEALFREAVRAKLEGRRPPADPEAVRRAQQALRLGSKEAAAAASYLHEVAEVPQFRFSAAKVLEEALRRDLEVDDATASVDPKVTLALLALRLPGAAEGARVETRRRLAATQLFTALLEAELSPASRWEQVVDESERASELAQVATDGDRARLREGFAAFAALPAEARHRRLAYLAQAVSHLEALNRLPEGTEPRWISGPEWRECDDREMRLLQTLSADQIPALVPKLAAEELGVPEGEVPEESEEDLFLHVRCDVCGRERLFIQSP